VALEARRAVAAEQERLGRRAEDEQHAVARAVEDLASTFRGADIAPLDVEASADPLIEACALVAAATGVTVPVAAARHAASQAADRIAAIARAARVRVRQVALTGAWWREDAGPLLGFGRDDGRPLALLPTGARRYVVVDPAGGTREPVDRHVAGAVAEAAFTFYRPFPDRAVGVWDLLAFGGRGFRREIASVAALGLAGGLLALLTPIATGTIVSTLIPSADRDGLYALAAALVVAALAAGAFELVRSLALLRASGRLGGALDAAVMDRLLSLPVPFFRGYSAGDLALRASAINVIQQTLTGIVLSTVVSSVFSLLSIGLMLYYDVHLTLVAVLAVVAVVVVAGLADRVQLGRQRQVLALQGRVAALVFQLINGIAALRVAGGELRAFAGWARVFGAQRRQAAAARRATAAVTVFSATWSVAATLAVFWALAFWARSGATTVEFIAFNAAFGQFTAAVLALAGAVASALGVLPLYERARPILQTLPEVGETKADPGRMRGAIELTGVSFRYVQDGPLVLQEVSLRIPPGQFVAFVGPSGAGKSTIYRMLLGFETPLTGTVFYDDQDLAGLDLRAVRRQIGVVLQNGRLMAGSIFENIVGAAPLTLDDAWEAARAAGFADDIQAMPMGMQTFIMEGATTLSGGQRQRLMIARAIVHRPRILLFDEATSALDNETQAIVSRSLERLQATRVVIAHRLSTIVRADRIYVIAAGRVVEAGTYDELMARNAEFARLARRQIA
jgi:ATP-binding cassette subfamily C protein